MPDSLRQSAFSKLPKADPYPLFKQSYINAGQEPEGDMPRNLAITPDGSELVIVHRETDNVTFFDMTTQSATHTVAVGDFPVHVTVSPDGQYAVVPNVTGNSVSIIDIPTHTLSATVPITGDEPFRVAVTPDSLFAVVGVINDGINSSFSVIDLTTFTEIRTYPSGPQGVYGASWTPETGGFVNIFTQFALTPDGNTLVLPDRGNAKVRLYDRITGAELAELSTATGPVGVDICSDGSEAIIGHSGNPGTLTKIDLLSQTVTDSFTINESVAGEHLRFTPDKSHALLAISNNVVFVDLVTGAVTKKISTGVVGAIELSFDGQYAFVSNYNARIIDIASQSLVKTITFAACAEAATSPVELRAVALNNRFRENVHFYNINGSSGSFLGYAKSGEPEEGDGTYGVDVSMDGTVAVACNVVSENVSIIDLKTNKVRSHVEVGDRPKEVRITPDGSHVVVCAMDANAVKIIDLSTDQVVKSLTINNRPGRVRISPDSQYAYVLNVAGTDRISFIKLDGANSVIEKQLSAGQTGSANGYSYTETSGIELSRDGSLLAVCDSFNDFLRLFDTASQTQIAQVLVGDFPIRAAFNPAGDRIYVANAFGDSLSVVSFDGLNWTETDTVTGIDFPLTVDVDETDSYIYLGNAGSSGTKGIRVIDTRFFNVVKVISFGSYYPRDSALCSDNSTLYIASTGSELVRIRAAGASSKIIGRHDLSGGPADMAFTDMWKTALFALPVPDGVDWVRRTFGMIEAR